MKILLKSIILQRLNKILLICLIISSGLLNQCSTEIKETGPVIAKVGSDEITVSEFQLFYELDPNFGIDSTGLPALRDELDKCIDQIISGNRAQEAKLFDDPIFSRALAWEKRMAMLRQLYRDVIADKIEISEEEMGLCGFDAKRSKVGRYVKEHRQILTTPYKLENDKAVFLDVESNAAPQHGSYYSELSEDFFEGDK